MSAPVPFDFAEDFSALPTASGRVDLTTADLDARLADSEATGYARGFSDGGSLESQSVLARLGAALDTAASGLGDLSDRLTRHIEASDAAAVRLALTFARKLAGRLDRDDRLAAAEQAFAALLLDLKGEAEVAIALHPDLTAEAETRLGTLMRERLAGFRLIIQPDADLMPGDCRITWSEGGLERDQSAIDARMDEIVGRLIPLTSEDPTQEPAHEDTP